MASDRPNILLIFTDQQRTDTLSCYDPHGLCQTPHLDGFPQVSTALNSVVTFSLSSTLNTR